MPLISPISLFRVLSRNVEKLRELREGIPSNPQNHVNLYAHRVVAEESEERKVEDEASIEEQLMREIQVRMEVESSLSHDALKYLLFPLSSLFFLFSLFSSWISPISHSKELQLNLTFFMNRSNLVLLNGPEHFLRRVNTNSVTKKRKELAMMIRLLTHTHTIKFSLELDLYIRFRIFSSSYSLFVALQETRLPFGGISIRSL